MRVTFLGNFGVDYSSENHHKRSIEALGHEVIALQEQEASGEQVLDWALKSDLFVWVHTHGWQTPGQDMVEVLEQLKYKGVTTATYHLDLWFGIERQKDLEQDRFYKHIQHFFTVDKLMADWFNENTEVQGHYLRPGVFAEECIMPEPIMTEPVLDVIFVGSYGYHHEWQWRPQLIDWLKDTYGGNFRHVGGDGQIPTTRGMALNSLYWQTKVAVGDSLCLNFDYPYYWSDRVYETLGRGGFMIHPYIKGMEEEFEDGKDLVFFKFGDFDDLKSKIDYYAYNSQGQVEREIIRRRGHEKVKNNYTYKHRWATIFKELELS